MGWKCYIAIGLLAAALHGEIVDRIVATVGRRVITASKVRQQMRVAALLDGNQLDTSNEAFEAMRERLIERTLIIEEMRVSRYPIPEANEVRGRYEEIVEQRGGPRDFEVAMRKYGATTEHVLDSLRYQRAVLNFTVFRFRPAVQVTPQDIQTYYDTRLTLVNKPPLDEVREDIERLLRAEQVNVLLDRWLAETRQQTHIETREEPGQ